MLLKNDVAVVETHLIGDVAVSLRLVDVLSDAGYVVTLVISGKNRGFTDFINPKISVYYFPFEYFREKSFTSLLARFPNVLGSWLKMRSLLRGKTIADSRSDLASYLLCRSWSTNTKTLFKFSSLLERRYHPSCWGGHMYSRVQMLASQFCVQLDFPRLRPVDEISEDFFADGPLYLFPLGSQNIRNMTASQLNQVLEGDRQRRVIPVFPKDCDLELELESTNKELISEIARRALFVDSLSELISLISLSGAIISIDTGPAHLAAYFGKPLIFVGGRAAFPFTAPRGENVFVIPPSPVSCHPCKKSLCDWFEYKGCMNISALVGFLKGSCR